MTRPFIGIIGGSGLEREMQRAFPGATFDPVRIDTPFGAPSDDIQLGTVHGTKVALVARHGAGHRFSPSAVPYRANIYALKALGVTHLIATGAVGSLREEIRPGDVVIVDQFIDRTVERPRTFFDSTAVHVDFADPTCPAMRQWLIKAMGSYKSTTDSAPRTHESGTYVCIEGPSFSTRAESRMHRVMGADVVGMTALPEARLAREAGISYALIALPTDYDSWRGNPAIPPEGSASLSEVIRSNLAQASSACVSLLTNALADIGSLAASNCSCSRALQNAAWSGTETFLPTELAVYRLILGKAGEPGSR